MQIPKHVSMMIIYTCDNKHTVIDTIWCVSDWIVELYRNVILLLFHRADTTHIKRYKKALYFIRYDSKVCILLSIGWYHVHRNEEHVFDYIKWLPWLQEGDSVELSGVF